MSRLAFVSACLLHAILIGAGYMSLPPMAMRIAADGWPLQHVEQAWSLLPLFSIPSAFATAHLLKRYGLRKLLAAVAVFGAAALGARALAPTFIVYAVILALYGALTGVLLTLLTLWIGSTAPEQQGRRQALFFGSYALGAAASVTAAEALAQLLGGWRPVQLLWAITSLMIALLALQSAKGSSINAQSRVENETFSKSRAIAYAAAYASYVGGYLALSNILPTRLRLMGWDPGLADSALAGSTLGFLGGSAVLGWLSDRYGHQDRMFRAGMAGMAIATLTGWWLASQGAFVTSLALFTFSGACAGSMSLFFAQMMADPAFTGQGQARLVSWATAASYAGGFVVPFGIAELPLSESLISPVIIAMFLIAAAIAFPARDQAATQV